MTIKAIIFDIDDTLVATSRCNSQCRARALDRLLDLLPETERAAATRHEEYLYRVFGWARMPDLWKAIIRELSAEPLAESLMLDLHRRFTEDFLNELSPLPEVIQTLERLDRRGVPIGIISDGDTEWQWRKLRTTGIDTFFDSGRVFIAIQSDLSRCKPSTVNFRRQEKAHGLHPHELAYVGDKPWDVLGANVAGWVSVRSRQAEVDQVDIWPSDPLRIEKPDHVVHSLDEVLELL